MQTILLTGSHMNTEKTWEQELLEEGFSGSKKGFKEGYMGMGMEIHRWYCTRIEIKKQ